MVARHPIGLVPKRRRRRDLRPLDVRDRPTRPTGPAWPHALGRQQGRGVPWPTYSDFWDQTRGHVILAGPTTARSIPRFAHADRTIVELRSGVMPEEVLSRFPGRVVFIGGGPPVWAAWARLIQHWDITRLPYDGEADRWFDPAWLTAG